MKRVRLVNLKVIVNWDDRALPHFITIRANELLNVGDELLVDDPTKDVVMTQITSLETDRRVRSALAETVKTVWARATDEVPLRKPYFEGARAIPLRSQFREMSFWRWARKGGWRTPVHHSQDQAAWRGICRRS